MNALHIALLLGQVGLNRSPNGFRSPSMKKGQTKKGSGRTHFEGTTSKLMYKRQGN